MTRVILIDDDPMFANIVKQHLVGDGHDVVHNAGAFGALTAVRQGGYDLILVDVHMPGIDGPKLVECFRERGVGHARIILMSSIDQHELERIARHVGAHGCFCKSSGLSELSTIVRKVLDGAPTVRPPRGGNTPQRSGRPASGATRLDPEAKQRRSR